MLGAGAALLLRQRVAVRGAGQQARRGQQHPAGIVRDLQRNRRHRGARRLQQDRTALGAELLRDRRQFRGDQLAQLGVGLQDPGQLVDLAGQPVALGLQLEAVELGEPAQRGVQDVLGLDLAQREPLDQPGLGLGGVLAVPDEPDDLVDVDEGHQQALDEVQAVAALGAAELAAPPDDLEAVVEVDLQQLLEAQRQGLPVHQRHVVDAEGLLHRRQLVELLQHGLRVEAVLDLDDQAQAVRAVGEVLDVGDALELLRADQVLDLRDDLLGADREGQFGDDQALAARRHVLHGHRRADLEGAAAVLVGVLDAREPDDPAARGQVGTRHEAHQRLQVRVRVADQVAGGRDDLAEVVRGHVGGHADRDSGRAVDQQVRVRGGQRDRLPLLAVVVGGEVDGVLVDRLRHQ